MKIKTLESGKDKLKLQIEDLNDAELNLLRRTAMYRVPVMAIEDVFFTENSSALYDEIVAHRLGLTPLKTDLKTYNFKKDCTCKGKGCAKCEVRMRLKTKGPKMVLASDLVSKDPSIKPVFPGTPITLLLEGQEVDLEVVATLGQGKQHAKWSPGHVYYQHIPKVKIKKGGETCKNAAEVCPQKVFEFKSGKLSIKNESACILCNSCIERCPEDTIEITGVPNKYFFTLESWGQLSPKELLTKATEMMATEVKDFKLK